MAFQIKDFASVAASCINWMRSTQRKVTDFSVGSVVRTMLEAVAIELEELYMRMFLGLKEAIPVAIYRTFDFARLTAKPASGTIRVTVTSSASPLVIPAGTVFQPDGFGITFASQADVIVAPGATQADISVLASTPGVGGNVPSGTAFDPQSNIDGFVSAASLFSFSSGSDDETEAQQKVRFSSFIATLNRGTIAALRYGLSLAVVRDASGNVAESARYTRIVEPWLTDNTQPVALVRAYIHNGTNTGASSTLLAEAQKVIDGYYDANGQPVSGWKAAGVKVDIIAATTSLTAVTGTVTLATGAVSADVEAAVEAAIGDYIAGLDIGADVLRSEIIAAAMGVDGVFNFALAAPASDAAVVDTAKAMPGTITLTMV